GVPNPISVRIMSMLTSSTRSATAVGEVTSNFRVDRGNSIGTGMIHVNAVHAGQIDKNHASASVGRCRELLMTSMKASFRRLAWSWLCTIAMAIAAVPACAQTLPLDKIKLPPGFAIELVAHVENARAMTWGAKGT